MPPARSSDRTGRRRADAERSIDAILNAAQVCLTRNPEASMTEIAKTAGVGRVTLYGHFESRQSLLEVLFERAIRAADTALDDVDVERGPADRALARLVATSWRTLERHGSLYVTGLHHLGPEGVRERHATVLERVERLIARGQSEGAFTDALPRQWLVTTFYTLIHAAAQEVDAGRLPAEDAPTVLTTTLLNTLGTPQPTDEQLNWHIPPPPTPHPEHPSPTRKTTPNTR